jgi:hypothetical protein
MGVQGLCRRSSKQLATYASRTGCKREQTKRGILLDPLNDSGAFAANNGGAVADATDAAYAGTLMKITAPVSGLTPGLGRPDLRPVPRVPVVRDEARRELLQDRPRPVGG